LAFKGLGGENCHAASLTNLTNIEADAIFSRMPRVINLYEAKAHLSALVDAAAHGEEIVIAKNGVAKARLVPIPKQRRERRASGAMKIRHIAEDFDETGESVIRDFEGSD
jgi:prevent-host-death family protein